MAGAKSAPNVDVRERLLQLLMERIATSTKRMHEGQVTYVIGNNGTGKSTILGKLAEQLSTTRPVRNVACIANSVYDRFKYGDVGPIRYLGARNASNAVFQSGVERQLSRLILQAMQIDEQLFQALCDAIHMKLTFTVGEHIADDVRKAIGSPTKRRGKSTTHRDLLSKSSLNMVRRIAEKGHFEGLTRPQISLLLRLLELNVDFDLHVHLEDGSAIRFGDLSTGEQSRTLLFAKVLSAMEESAVFLIDEPEISLHLHWQMDLHKTLMDLLSYLDKFHVVIATHAPVIISEAAKFDSESHKNMVAVLRRPSTDDAALNRHGPGRQPVTCDMHSFAEVASHEQLVLRYFQTATYHAHEVSVEIADAVLRVAENRSNKEQALQLLKEVQDALGLDPEAKEHLRKAIDLIEKDRVPSVDTSV